MNPIYRKPFLAGRLFASLVFASSWARSRALSRQPSTIAARFATALRIALRRGTFWLLVGIGFAAAPAYAGNIFVTDTGTAGDTTCTLAQAIAEANAVNGVSAASVGSATTNPGACASPPNTAATGMNYILIQPTTPSSTITLSAIDNYWYGPNALPPIASSIVIVGEPTTLIASHSGDPTPATANAFRFFYISGGLELPAGTLELASIALQGGYAKGGDSGSGGGGGGMGGAIFNQGSLQLLDVSLIGNTAHGGAVNGGVANGGGGMGEDGLNSNGGGVGGALGGSYGGIGAYGTGDGSGGGGGG
jgi:hypothetical protein